MHYIIIIIVIAIIVGLQIYIWYNTASLIRHYHNLFKDVNFKTESYYVSAASIQAHPNATIQEIGYHTPNPECNDELEITWIDTEEEITHPLLKTIVQSINTYLLRNRGAVSDFSLIKDIVERNCDTKYEEFNVQVPMPLYLGLMGTMLGIIFGIGYISLVGEGFSAFINNPSESIGTLMGGVAIAMIASFIGIFLTTRNSWAAKDAVATMEEGKNKFYTWIQTQLLPTVGGTGNTLATLQQNLLRFNRSFATNTTKLDSALQKLGKSYDSQMELLQTIENLDIQKIATANISVLRELQTCIPQLERFNQYLHLVNSFVMSAEQLNTTINDQLQRTSLIEEMGVFFKQEVQAIEQRKVAINQAVGEVDDHLQTTIAALGEHAEKSLQEINEALIKKQNVFNQAVDEQQDILQQKMREAGNIFEDLKKAMQTLNGTMDKQNEKTDSELTKMDELHKEMAAQNDKLSSLIHAVEHMTVDVSVQGNKGSSLKLPRGFNILLIFFLSAGLLIFIIQLVSIILSFFNGMS